MIDLDSPMHWSRWGDADKAHPVSDSMRELLELFVGTTEERPAVPLEQVRLPAVGLTDGLLDELRDLAHTIRPSVLTDSGLLDAIEAQAARLPIPVTINASRNLRGVRFPADIEDAAWYGLAEAMTNALKHSTATRLDVRLAQVSGRLELEVADDGSGFDPPQAARFGLTALADRMAVLGGQLVHATFPGIRFLRQLVRVQGNLEQLLDPVEEGQLCLR